MREEKKRINNDFETRVTTIISRGEVRIYTPITHKRKQKKHQDQTYKSKSYSNESHAKCKRCKNWFSLADARKDDRPEHCRLKCKNRDEKKRSSIQQRLKTKQIPTPHRRRLNQIRRVEKKNSNVDFYDSDAWRSLRFKVLRKYGYKCMACGARPGIHPLHVDHIRPRSKYPRLELDPDNLQVLCRDCNLGKSNSSRDDLRTL